MTTTILFSHVRDRPSVLHKHTAFPPRCSPGVVSSLVSRVRQRRVADQLIAAIFFPSACVQTLSRIDVRVWTDGIERSERVWKVPSRSQTLVA